MQDICSFFKIEKGITALIGGGGKTSSMIAFAEQLKSRGSVIVCTSTHILRPPQYPYLPRLSEHLRPGEIVSTGSIDGQKLTLPEQNFEELTHVADYVIVEADGSRQLPLKAHAPHEPVIPDRAKTVLAVIGIDGLGKPIRQVAHRPERFAFLSGASIGDVVTEEMIARVVSTYPRVDGIIINKADDSERIERAKALASKLSVPVAVTAWQSDHPIKAFRRNEP